MDKSGHSYKGHGGVLRVSKGSLICMKAALHNGIYVLEATTLSGEAAIGENKTDDQTKLWHYRMAHISEQGLRELSKQGILGAEKLTDLDQCETCIFGKSSKVKFPKKENHISKAPLEYIHSDLWGLSQSLPHGGARYFLSIIDDFSRMVWVYVIKSKDGTFETWKTLIENQKGMKIKVISTNNGLEICNKEFA